MKPNERDKQNRGDAATMLLRRISDLICLHGLCVRRTCRRARACRGEPRDCLTRYAPLVPQDAREGAKAMLDGWQLGWDFDELLDEARDDVLALAQWSETIGNAYRARAPLQTVRRSGGVGSIDP